MSDLTDAQKALRDDFIERRGYWNEFWDGLLRLDETVVDIIPEFGTNGKDVITVEQTMLHIGGFPMAPFRPDDWQDRETRLARFALA